MVSEEFIKAEYPLHLCVWQNDYKTLETLFSKKRCMIKKKGQQGEDPLMLAVTLGHLESARTLLNSDANVNCENLNGWTGLFNAEQLNLCISGARSVWPRVILNCCTWSWKRRDFQRYTSRMAGIPELLQRLKQAPDFYVEMKWEFTSWVPLVSRMCPSDIYKVYKQGSNVRIDTTLLGFDHTSWQRGNRSYVFQGLNDGATMMEIDHDLQQVYCEQMRTTDDALGILIPNEDSVSQRLTTPIVTTYVDTEKISFERNKAGMWGWRSDKSEVINGYECKVFSASNVELITKTRTEHLTETDKARSKNSKTPLQNFLGIAEVGESQAAALLPNEEYANSSNPCNITPEEYFDRSIDLHAQGRDIGRPKRKIPLFHVLNARITFGNIFAMDQDVPFVTKIQEEERLTCVLDENIFKCPPGYSQIGNEDDLLQFAIQQSLIDAGTEKEEVDIWEALKAQKPSRPETPNFIGEEDRQLQRAIQASLELYQHNVTCSDLLENSSPEGDSDLHMALLLSQQQQERERQREEQERLQEQKLLEEILELSLTEK
ncbi:hypothetical protein NQ314_008243 [Rhamnusium bicolor]|uniref:Ankyrin repeat domain-containing protein n=1 Tax=Rhamnusium bicolor TaxID=1586634 RepID=A0AAV8YD68_9CUCU|nr:hypothetical protein NQ314_008243 [Rhamnusium bicolor]